MLSNKLCLALVIAIAFLSVPVTGSGKGSVKSGKGGKGSMKAKTVTIKVTNLSVRQPFSPFFVMTHDSSVPPVYTFGAEPSEPLALLAENGDPGPLVEMYSSMEGVGSAFGFMEMAPYFGGDTAMIEVPYDKDYPYVTLATMAINTNDCFVAISGAPLKSGYSAMLPGLDAGSEVNNELCDSIPGPACADIDTTNIRSGDGEGFVHVHPGFHGVGDLSESRDDWRNPMAMVYVM